MATYIGDSANMFNRINQNHCNSNVEASSLRKSVAQLMGYTLIKTLRPGGSTKIRIDLPNPRVGETNVSDYIRAGSWKFVTCDSYDEAHDFQWYAIDQINPTLNINNHQWNHAHVERYELLFQQLINCPSIPFNNLMQIPNGFGVYLFHHN